MVENKNNQKKIITNLKRKPKIQWNDAEKREFTETENSRDVLVEEVVERKVTATPRSREEEILYEVQDGLRMVRGEIAMWRAVITQALMDASSNSAKMEMQYERRKAAVWLEGRNDDFHTVCQLADMPSAYVREKSLQALTVRCDEKIAIENKNTQEMA